MVESPSVPPKAVKVGAASVSVQDNIERHLAGGAYRPSREVLMLMAANPIEGQQAADRERAAQARASIRYAYRLLKNRHGNNKHSPHQGAREKARRLAA